MGEEGKPTEEETETETKSETSEKKRVTLDDVKEVVADAIKPIHETLSKLVGSGEESGKSEEEETGGDKEKVRRTFGLRDIERKAEEAVREAVSKIQHEQDHANMHKKEEKKEPESAPVKERWSTRVMGWNK